jgi:thioredoxin 1
VVEQVAAEYQGKLKVVSANIADAPETAGTLGIFSIPALVFFKGGQEAGRLVGAVPKPRLVDAIKKNLGL